MRSTALFMMLNASAIKSACIITVLMVLVIYPPFACLPQCQLLRLTHLPSLLTCLSLPLLCWVLKLLFALTIVLVLMLGDLPLPPSLEGECNCCAAHARIAAGHAKCKFGPHAKSMKREEEYYFCDSKPCNWIRVPIAAPKEFQPGRMWVVACHLCQRAFCLGYPLSSLYTWPKSDPSAKVMETQEEKSVCSSCWMIR